MVNFSKEQLDAIRNSDEFIDYLAGKGNDTSDEAEETALKEYIADQDNVKKWMKKFAKESTKAANTYMEGEIEDVDYEYEVKPRKNNADRALIIAKQGQSDVFELRTSAYDPRKGDLRGEVGFARVAMIGDNKQELEISTFIGKLIPCDITANEGVISVEIEGYDEILLEVSGKNHTEIQEKLQEQLREALKEKGAENDTAVSWSASLSKIYSDAVYARDFLVKDKKEMQKRLSDITYVYTGKAPETPVEVLDDVKPIVDEKEEKKEEKKSPKLKDGEVLSWVEEEKSDKHYEYVIKESTKNANGHLRTNRSVVERDGKSDSFVIKETTSFDKDNKHTQTLKSKDITAKLDGSEFEGIILYGNKRKPEEFKVKVEKTEEKVILSNGNGRLEYPANFFESEESQKEFIEAVTRAYGHNDAVSIVSSIVAAYQDVQNVSTILQSHVREIKGIANPPRITDIVNNKEEVLDNVIDDINTPEPMPEPTPEPEKTDLSYVPDIDQVLRQHGFKDDNFIGYLSDRVKNPKPGEELNDKEKAFFQAIIDAYRNGEYKKTIVSYSKEEPNKYRRLNLELIKTEEDVKIAEKVMQAFGYDIVADYREHPEKVGFPVRAQKVEPTPEPTPIQEVTKYVPDIDAALTQHGFKDDEFVKGVEGLLDKETDEKKKAFYEAVIKAYKSNEYKTSKRKNLNEELIKTEEDVRTAEEVMQALGFNIEPGKTNYQEEASAHVDFPVRNQKVLETVVIDDREPTPDPDPIIDDDEYEVWYETVTKTEEIEVPTTVFEESRERSPNSDDNRRLLAELQLKVLRELDYIDQPLYDAAKNDPEKAIATINEKMPLKGEKADRFSDVMIDKILAQNSDFKKLAIPSILANSYERTVARLEIAKRKKDNNDITFLSEQKERLEVRMDDLTEQMYTGVISINYDRLNYSDKTNIADIYDGYAEMLKVRRPYANEDLQKKIDLVQKKLDADIAKYDTAWGLDAITKDNATQVEQNFENLTVRLGEISQNLSEETYNRLSNVQFFDKDNNLIPQFLDKDGNPVERWSEGCRIAPESRLEAIIDFAKNNTAIRQMSSSQEVKDEELREAFETELLVELFTIDNVAQTYKGVAEEKDKFTDPKYRKEFEERILDLERPLEIKDHMYTKAISIEANNTMACINRVSKKVGANSPLLRKIHQQIAKHDPLKNDRFENGGISKKEARIRLGLDLVKGYAVTTVVSTGVKLTSAAIATATGVARAKVAAGVGLGLALVGTGVNFGMYWRQMKKAGLKPSVKDFFTSKDLRDAHLATLCGCTAGGCFLAGMPKLGLAAGAGAIFFSARGTYKKAQKLGLGEIESGAWGFGKAATIVAGAMTGQVMADAIQARINTMFPDNRIFQEEKLITPGKDAVPGTDPQTVIDYDALNSDAERYILQYDRLTPEGYQNYLDAVDTYNQAHPEAPITHPASLYLNALNAGMPAEDGIARTLYGYDWRSTNDVPLDAVQALKGLINSDGSINHDAVQAYNEHNFQNRVGLGNFVGKVNGDVTQRPDLYPHKNPNSTFSDMNQSTKVIPGTPGQDAVPPDYDPVAKEGGFAAGLIEFFKRVPERVQGLKKRLGGFADKIFRTERTVMETKTVEREEVIEHKRKKDVDIKKLMMDEYKIVYGNVDEKSDAYKAYYERVEQERQKENPDLSMLDYLRYRRGKLDELVDKRLGMLEATPSHDGHISPRNETTMEDGTKGVIAKKDYAYWAEHNDVASAMIVQNTRQSLEESNLSPNNYTGKITLSHFMKYMEGFCTKSEIVADGSRRASLIPEYKHSGKAVIYTNLDAYLVKGLPLEDCQQEIRREDIRDYALFREEGCNHHTACTKVGEKQTKHDKQVIAKKMQKQKSFVK
ncbi:MAG: hypothetical protein E7019_05295 [Alphaproteobacteria bacterium]|nr:hypothetical protein [Alphaproteobacteria bacterium]